VPVAIERKGEKDEARSPCFEVREVYAVPLKNFKFIKIVKENFL
jgi:hypothetical protein